MPNAGLVWEQLLYGLAGTHELHDGGYARGRDDVLAALAAVGFTAPGASALDEDALRARPGHQLVIVSGDGADDHFDLVPIPDDELDDDLRAALDALDGAVIDVGTAGDAPDVWAAWVKIALATGAREREDLELGGDDLGLDDDAIAALAGRWAARRVDLAAGGRLDGAALDLRLVGVTYVHEHV